MFLKPKLKIYRSGQSVPRIKQFYDFIPTDADDRAGPAVAAGDYYGIGHKNPTGRMRDSSSPGINPVSKKKLGTPPTSVV